MRNISRREFAGGLGCLALSGAAVASPAIARGAGKVVVIGGGPGGATVAGEVKRAAAALDVTLIERQKHYTSCFFSNHYIGGFRSFASITHSYDGLSALGVRVVHDTAERIDPVKKTVLLGSGRSIAYDRLVVAPGIDFKFGGIEGYSEAAIDIMPHAWKGGWQSRLLRRKLEAMEDGGVVVVTAPRNPYRCPPGPYERACVIAHYLKTAKPKSKLVVLDPKMAFSKQPAFEEAFAKYYDGIVDLHLTNDIDDMSLARVDTKTGEVVTKSGLKIKAAVANIIPDQRAGNIASLAGLNEGDWCPVDFANFKSLKAPDIYVLGDAATAQEMPKSAFSANNQAKGVVRDILADLAGKEKTSARYRNTCWSLLAPGDSVKIGADYTPGEINGKRALVPSDSFVSKPGESTAVRKENYADSIAWYATICADIFGEEAETHSARRGETPG